MPIYFELALQRALTPRVSLSPRVFNRSFASTSKFQDLKGKGKATTESDSKQFYVTTPIFYVNANPHIGHLHSTLLADVITRFNSLRFPSKLKSILCTGTDEHGLKIQRVAEGQGIDPKLLCDTVSKRFLDLAEAAGIDYDVFMRTTEDRHKVAVQHVWKELESRGHIYKSAYSGWYAVSDEAYYTAAQVQEIIDEKTGEKSTVCIETGTKVEWMEEENYKFRLSSFKEPLIKWLESDLNVLQPPSRSTALLASLNSTTSTDLQDLSISRPVSRLSWGIRVPGDEAQTIYVWIDALINYLTAAGYPWKGGEGFTEQNGIWPPDVMIVGKDIIKFHALYLPAILMALDVPLPHKLLAHGHWTMDKFKMSKSRGNVADPFEAIEFWGRDAMRTYLMRRGGNSAVDSDYSLGEIETFYRKDLAGQLGNLLARLSPKIVARLETGTFINASPIQFEEEDQILLTQLQDLPEQFSTEMIALTPASALSTLFQTLASANRHIQILAPWKSTSTPSQIHRALHLSFESLRISGILLLPFMPEKAMILLNQLGIPKGSRKWENAILGGAEKEILEKVQVVSILFPSKEIETVVVPVVEVKTKKVKGKKLKKVSLPKIEN